MRKCRVCPHFLLFCVQEANVRPFDYSSDPATFRHDLFNIARTTLSSKVLAQDKEYFANLAVDAVLRLKVRLTTNR
jgi:T-complex protein 1 subunit beta